jgi:hypothetical protein
MMVPFSSRSKHTLKMKNKPISEGFKIWALCDRGYLWDFLFYSCTTGKLYIYPLIIIIHKLIYKRLGTVGLEKHPQLSPTHAAVFQLMKTLLYKAY